MRRLNGWWQGWWQAVRDWPALVLLFHGRVLLIGILVVGGAVIFGILTRLVFDSVTASSDVITTPPRLATDILDDVLRFLKQHEEQQKKPLRLPSSEVFLVPKVP